MARPCWVQNGEEKSWKKNKHTRKWWSNSLKTMQLPHYIKSLQNSNKLRNSSFSDKERYRSYHRAKYCHITASQSYCECLSFLRPKLGHDIRETIHIDHEIIHIDRKSRFAITTVTTTEITFLHYGSYKKKIL